MHLLNEPNISTNIKEKQDETDSISDFTLKIALKLTLLLQNNIDSLKIPEILKDALKKLKALFFKKDRENEANAQSVLQPRESGSQTTTTSRSTQTEAAQTEAEST